jgi:hypothetical protein
MLGSFCVAHVADARIEAPLPIAARRLNWKRSSAMTDQNTVNITAESDKVPLATQGDRREPIEGQGTPGKMAKCATAATITDSIIPESAGRIGIGTTTPTATLTVTSARSIASAEKSTGHFGNQDFHVSGYQGQLHVLVAQQAALARHTSWRESDRTISISRVMGS